MTLRDPLERISDASEALEELANVQQQIEEDEERNKLFHKTRDQLIRSLDFVISVRRIIFVVFATALTIGTLLYRLKPANECQLDEDGYFDLSGIASQVVNDLKNNTVYPELRDELNSNNFTVQNNGCLVIIRGTEKSPTISNVTQYKIGESISEEVKGKMKGGKPYFEEFSE